MRNSLPKYRTLDTQFYYDFCLSLSFCFLGTKVLCRLPTYALKSWKLINSSANHAEYFPYLKEEEKKWKSIMKWKWKFFYLKLLKWKFWLLLVWSNRKKKIQKKDWVLSYETCINKFNCPHNIYFILMFFICFPNNRQQLNRTLWILIKSWMKSHPPPWFMA